MNTPRGILEVVELYLGTGGYANDDWIGLLYPPGTKPATYLEVYAQHFNAVELNASFYAIPGVKAFEGMLRRSDGRVRFAVKLHRSMTHERTATDETYRRLFESVRPLAEAGVLGPFLAQFPYAFHRTPENRRYLLDLVTRFEGYRLAVEFRHASWDQEAVRAAFRERGLVWVANDYPPLRGLPKPVLYVTAEVAYLRFHGRNTRTWWEGRTQAERHDYLYTPDELAPWARALAAQQEAVREAWLIFNNTTKGHALRNLAMMKELLEAAGLEVPAHPPRL